MKVLISITPHVTDFKQVHGGNSLHKLLSNFFHDSYNMKNVKKCSLFDVLTCLSKENDGIIIFVFGRKKKAAFISHAIGVTTHPQQD